MKALWPDVVMVMMMYERWWWWTRWRIVSGKWSFSRSHKKPLTGRWLSDWELYRMCWAMLYPLLPRYCILTLDGWLHKWSYCIKDASERKKQYQVFREQSTLGLRIKDTDQMMVMITLGAVEMWIKSWNSGVLHSNKRNALSTTS